MSEERIKPAAVWISFAALGAFFLAVQAGSLFVFKRLNRPAPEPQAASTFEKTVSNPAGPLLEETVFEDIRAFRAHEQEILNSYGWVDRSRGTIRIPVERAIKMMLAKGNR